MYWVIVYANMTDNHIINIVLNGTPCYFRIVMAHYQNLRATPIEWRRKLQEMDIINNKIQHKGREFQSKDKGKKGSFECVVQLKGGEAEKENPKGELVPFQKKEKR